MRTTPLVPELVFTRRRARHDHRERARREQRFIATVA